MCPNMNNKKVKIGSMAMIKWIDGYNYKAKLLSKGSKFIIFIYYLNSLLFIVECYRLSLSFFFILWTTLFPYYGTLK